MIYLGDDAGERELLEALGAGRIDALARGEVGNRDAARASGDSFVVTALDDKIEHGGFAIAMEDRELASCLNERLGWLTDGRRIGYAEWLDDPSVFMRRAEEWNRS